MQRINYEVPFYTNKLAGTHCFQAVLKMAFAFFDPQHNQTWARLEEITDKSKDKWTWPYAALVWMKENGYEVINISQFSLLSFIQDQEEYLKKFYGPKIAGQQLRHSDMPAVMSNAKRLQKLGKLKIDMIPQLDDIVSLLQKGFLVVAQVDYRRLHHLPGYTGHFVLIKGFTEKHLIIHEPGGLVGKRNWSVSNKHFIKAWSRPNEAARSLIAIRKVS